MTCTPSAVAYAAACYCGPEDSQRAQIIYLLQLLAGNTMTPAQLAAAAAPFLGLPEDLFRAEMLYLTCAAATAAGA
jgi:hypothetical protein